MCLGLTSFIRCHEAIGFGEFGMHGDVDRWEAFRDSVHAEVCERGFDAKSNSFTQSYDSTELDAIRARFPDHA